VNLKNEYFLEVLTHTRYFFTVFTIYLPWIF